MQWGFAAAPGHPLLKSVLDTALPTVISQNFDLTYPHFVHAITGPGVWTIGLAKWLLPVRNETAGMKLDEVRTLKDAEWRAQGICILTEEEMERRLTNEYASQGNGFAGDGQWSSWVQERDWLLAKRAQGQDGGSNIAPR